MARNGQKPGWAPRNDPYLGNRKLFRCGPNRKVVAPDILVICCVTKIVIPKQKIDFWPRISKFWGQNCTSSSLAAKRSPTCQCFQHERGVSLVPCFEGTKNFTPSSSKYWFFAQKRPNLAKNWHFWPNIGLFGPFDLMPDQITMQTRCLGGFPVKYVPQILLIPVKIRIFGPKLAFLAKYCHFWPIWSHARPKNKGNKVPRCCFRYVGTKTFASSSMS